MASVTSESLSEIQQLRDRVEELEALLGMRPALKEPGGRISVRYRVLGVIAMAAPRVATRAFIYQACWADGETLPVQRTIDQHVRRLRQEGIEIQTQPESGYWMTVAEAKRVEGKYS